MKTTLCSVSGAALLFGLAGLQPALAQQGGQTVTPSAAQQAQTGQSQQGAAQTPDQTPAATQDSSATRVIVTGSLIPTTQENAPRPVEVFTRQDMQEAGSPSIGEFIRDLSISYDSPFGLGEAVPGASDLTGFNSPDLRGLGPNATLTLLNGRRLASTNGGFGADINTLPSNAMQQAEILRTGASTTYGAGSVGGVINFITRRDVDSPELTIERRMYDGSEGETTVSLLTGWVGESSNLLLSYEYQETPRMAQSERDFSSQPFMVNPEVWTMDATNPGKYVRYTNYWSGTPGAPVGATNAQRQIYDFRDESDCTALGGVRANVAQPNRPIPGTPLAPLVPAIADLGCVVPQYLFEDLVNENQRHNLFIEFNADITDNMRFHVDALYSKSETTSYGLPIGLLDTNSRGVMAPTATPGGAGASSTLCGVASTGCNFVIPVEVRTYSAAGVQNTGAGTAVRNPFIDDFNARTGAGLLATDALYTGLGWRPFMFGGNPYTESGLKETTLQRERFQVNAGVNGDITSDNWIGALLGDVRYDYAAQFNQYLQTTLTADVVTSRLQDALRGYGGPGCTAIDRVPTDFTNNASYARTVGIQSDTAPGTNGCQFFNPFASNFPISIANRAANPQYNAALPEHSPELINWLFRDRVRETQFQSVTIDATWSGAVSENLLSLPGGEIGWAAGFQWRQLESRVLPGSDTELDRAFDTQLCPWPDPQFVAQGRAALGDLALTPGQLGCRSGSGASASPGAFLTSDEATVNYGDEQAFGYFAEVQLPILSNLNFLASWRREEFNGGALAGDIWNVSGKWDITDNFFVRADYGTNFRAEGLNAQPGEVTVSNFNLTRFQNHVIELFDLTDPNLGTEEDATLNVGIGYVNRDFFGGRFNAGIDFFETVIDGELVGGALDTGQLTTVLNSVFGPSQNLADTPVLVGPGVGCDSPFLTGAIQFLAFSNGPCTAATIGTDVVGQIRIQTNGGGLVTNGLEYRIGYSRPLFDGNLGFQVRATQNLVYKVVGYNIGDQVLDEGGDRLGLRNSFASGGRISRELRLNASARWSNKNHTINLIGFFDSGVHDPGYLACQAPYYDATQATAALRQVSRVGNYYSCGDSLTAVNLLSTGLAAVGADAYSTYGVSPQDRTTFNLTYMYRPSMLDGLELRASVINLTDEDPVPDQTRRGFSNGDPRGRVLELEVTKKF